MNQFKHSLHLLLVTLFTFALFLIGMRYVGDEKAPRSMAVHKADTVNVDIASNLFTPKVITVTVGDTVTWMRLNGAHNVHADNNSFRLGEPPSNNPGSTWITVSHTFTGAGIFLYYCDAHGASGGVGMSGRVIVQSGSGDTPINGLTATNDSPTVLGSATHFTATVTAGNNISYTWNFGDGASDTGATASHTYSTTGLFTATVTAVNSAGSQNATTLVNVSHAIVRLRNAVFEPKNITINVGQRVTWLRVDGTHNVRAADGSFRLGDANGNVSGAWKTASYTFTKAGAVAYYCELHGSASGTGMAGTVMVQGATISQTLYLPLVERQVAGSE